MAPSWPTLALIALLVVGSLDRWRRGKGWSEPRLPAHGLGVAGIAAGAVALAAAIVFAAPLLESMTERAVEWSETAVVRGSATAFVTIAMFDGHAHCMLSQLVLAQSEPAAHFFPIVQRGHVLPPQSVSVSSPLRWPSLHVGVLQTRCPATS